jgi:acid phosphatase (class B)
MRSLITHLLTILLTLLFTLYLYTPEPSHPTVLPPANCSHTNALALLPHITNPTHHQHIGFDIDDTILFSTPCFIEAKRYAKANNIKPFSPPFWSYLNTLDHTHSKRLPHTIKLLKAHQALGHTIYLITARPHTESETLSTYLSTLLGIPSTHVFFAKPKTKLIRHLNLTYYYGDSDTDISDAIKAGAIGIRVPRSPSSDYGTRKYKPGRYDELILTHTPTPQ